MVVIFIVVTEGQREVLWTVDKAGRIDGLSDVYVGRKVPVYTEVDVDDVMEVVEVPATRCLTALALEGGQTLASAS